MTHYTMGDILQDASSSSSSSSSSSVKTNGDSSAPSGDVPKENPREERKKEERKKAPEPELASYIVSASISGNDQPTRLPKPISFTMRHIKVSCFFQEMIPSGRIEFKDNETQLSSLNIDQESYLNINDHDGL